jgi:hypothetical protein
VNPGLEKDQGPNGLGRPLKFNAFEHQTDSSPALNGLVRKWEFCEEERRRSKKAGKQLFLF